MSIASSQPKNCVDDSAASCPTASLRLTNTPMTSGHHALVTKQMSRSSEFDALKPQTEHIASISEGERSGCEPEVASDVKPKICTRATEDFYLDPTVETQSPRSRSPNASTNTVEDLSLELDFPYRIDSKPSEANISVSTRVANKHVHFARQVQTLSFDDRDTSLHFSNLKMEPLKAGDDESYKSEESQEDHYDFEHFLIICNWLQNVQNAGEPECGRSQSRTHGNPCCEGDCSVINVLDLYDPYSNDTYRSCGGGGEEHQYTPSKRLDRKQRQTRPIACNFEECDCHLISFIVFGKAINV